MVDAEGVIWDHLFVIRVALHFSGRYKGCAWGQLFVRRIVLLLSGRCKGCDGVHLFATKGCSTSPGHADAGVFIVVSCLFFFTQVVDAESAREWGMQMQGYSLLSVVGSSLLKL